MAGTMSITSDSGPVCEFTDIFDIRHGVGLGGVVAGNNQWPILQDSFSASNQTIRHSPVQVVRKVDAFSPRLMSGLTSYEIFPIVEFNWRWVNVETDQVEYDYHIRLEDAQLIYAAPWDFVTEQSLIKEILAFSYREITWKYLAPEPAEGDFIGEASSEGFF